METSSGIISTAILVVGSITCTYLTVAWKNRRDKRTSERSDKDVLVDVLSKTIEQFMADADRRSKLMEDMQGVMQNQNEEIERLRKVNEDLMTQLSRMRDQGKQDARQILKLQAQVEALRQMVKPATETGV